MKMLSGNEAGITRNSPRLMRERPELAMLVAEIVAEFAYIDRMQSHLVENAMGERGHGFVKSDEIGAAILEEIPNTQNRIKVVKKILSHTVPPELVEECHAIAKQLLSIAPVRNRIVHAYWALTDDFPDDLVINEPNGTRLRCTASDLEKILEDILRLRGLLHDFVVKLGYVERRTR